MLDLIFAAYLLFLLPGWQLWKSLKKKVDKPKPDAARCRVLFRKNLVFILSPLLALAALMAWSGRSAAALGLDIPVSAYGQWGLAIVVLLFAGLTIWSIVAERRQSAEKAAADLAKYEALEGIPQSPAELWQQLFLFLCIGAGWELLYRGFLMLVLPPLTGTAFAVILAAVAYGVAHGYQSRNQFLGSIFSAFLFTLGYVYTQSLWWLMLLHVLLPVFGTLTAYIAQNKAPKAAAA